MLVNYPCQYLKGVGPKNAIKLKHLGIETAQDLLFHLPLRYEDRTQLTALNFLTASFAVVTGKIVHVNVVRKPKSQLYCLIADNTGQLTLRFIHYTNTQKENFVIGKHIFAMGDVRYASHGYEMIHPEYQFLTHDAPIPLPTTLTPIYPSTEGLSQRLWQRFSEQVVLLLEEGGELEELLSKEILQRFHLPHLKQALITLHRPEKHENILLLNRGQHPAQQRLILEELLVHRLAMLKRRAQYIQQRAISLNFSPSECEVFQERTSCARAPYHPWSARPSKPHILIAKNLVDATSKITTLLSRLPFQLTAAQQRVSQEILHDLKHTHPMMRLVQGDVGSGKTIVAAIAAIRAVENKMQVAMMTPTELLAEQHFRVMQHWLEPLNIRVALLKGGMSKRIRQILLEELVSGKIDVLLGTHALFQNDVHFKQLALVIVDEQHRFGVHQRLALKEKGMHQGFVPHQLIMTATPIPRTLAMSLYADLDYSVIDELPAGRKPITTLALSNQKRTEVTERIQHLCAQGQQIYWVCPLIEESDILQCQAAEKSYAELSQQLTHLNVALLHGKMKPKEKESIMAAFKQGDYHVLVATTVIEVGVDVPNATLMVIENAERLGLAQLHQLRGRVGRGRLESYCVLLYQEPLGKIARERIAMMRATQDGFKIAEKDLELRGAGEILGARQTGEMNFRIANLVRDQKWLHEVQYIAEQLWQYSPEVCDKIIERWLGKREALVGV